jgi:hypothetical protein
MKCTYLAIYIILLFTFLSYAEESKLYEISGKVTDFNGNPIDSVTIQLKNKAFEEVYETLSDKNGTYSMRVKEGDYYCLYAIKLSEYSVNKLEYWTWNVPIHKNTTINPQYDRMEIYGINVFEPQVGPFETYMIYFRPMSLSKMKRLLSEQNKNKEEIEKTSKLINISPESITPEELTIEINGTKTKIVGINKITEYARGSLMYGYCVQVLKPENHKKLRLDYDLISVTLHSLETDEWGKAEAFVKR